MMRSATSEVQNSLQAALSCMDVRETCRRLTQLLDACGNNQLSGIFQRLMDDIFITRIYKWGLTKSGISPTESLSVREFLGINGPMFRLIHRMQQHGIQAQGPSLASANLQSDMYDGLGLLTAFEAYFSHFAQFIKRSTIIIQNDPLPSVGNRFQLRSPNLVNSPGSEDAIYFVLLDEYLGHYFPTTSDVKPPTLNIGMPFKTSPKPHHNITKSSLLLRHDSAKPAITGHASFGEAWCCDVLMGILSTLWLDDVRFQGEIGSPSNKLPKENHVRAVRLLVKHVHFFGNAHLENTLAKRFQNDSLLEQVNQSVMSKFQPKLLTFLTHCFEVWPLDQTFRIVLETWLSYIQPWRYVKSQENAAETHSVNNNWYHFVHTNLKFYTALFQIAIKRFLRMDIGTNGNSLLLFRVAKIYSLPNLITLIDQAEEASPLAYQGSRNYNSYISQSYGSTAEAKDEDIFSPSFTNVVKQLLDVITQAVETLKASGADGSSTWSNQAMVFFGYGALLENSDRPVVMGADRKKTEQNLNYAMRIFSEMYELPIPKVNKKQAATSGKATEDIADHSIDEDGKISLSPLGQYQLQNNLKKFPIIPKTDPELRPICSYENAFLVRFLYSVSSRFNANYQSEIEALCQKKDILGRVCKILFCPIDQHPTLARGSHSPPRLSLRFLAHYRSLFYIAVFYVLSRLFGYNFFFVFFYMLLLAVIWIFLKALFMKD